MLQVVPSPDPIREIQLPVRSEFLRNFLRAMATSLSRTTSPSVLIIPPRDRHELHSGIQIIANSIRHCGEPRFLQDDYDFCEKVLEETHHTRPVVHLDGDALTIELQDRIVHEWDRMAFRPPFTLFVVSKDPGELLASGLWIRSFREKLSMPTYRWPEATMRLSTPERRVSFFAKVFEEIARKEIPNASATMIEPGAREFLLKTLFTNFTPHYVGNYVKLAVDLISTMKQFGESKLTAKMVITLTDPGNELART